MIAGHIPARTLRNGAWGVGGTSDPMLVPIKLPKAGARSTEV